MAEDYPEVLGKKVDDIMSPNVLTMPPNVPVVEAASYMARTSGASP